MVTDTIADLIIQIKNAGMVKKPFVEVPYSQFKYEVAKKLSDMQFVGAIEKKGSGVKKIIQIDLNYNEESRPVAINFKRISKPSCRVYTRVGEIIPVKQGIGDIVLSTPKGVLSGKEARKQQVGGEVLFSIW